MRDRRAVHRNRLCFGRHAMYEPGHETPAGEPAYKRPEGFFSRWRPSAQYRKKVRMHERVKARKQFDARVAL